MKETKRNINKFNTEIRRRRKKIPRQYNQAKLADYLTDDDISLMVSITTRSDGKTYNYLAMMVDLAMKFDSFKFLLIARHFTLRNDYMESLQNIMHEQFKLSKKDSVFFDVNARYIIMYVKEKPIALITDLNSASDLKYSSQVLKDYRLIIFDEFIALKGDYLPDELNQIKTIYESVARPTKAHQILETPKILLMGNPVNWESPLLSYFNLYKVLEKQKINTIEKHGNVAMERYRNDKSLGKIDTSLFGNDKNSSYNGEFRVNDHLIADSYEQTHYINQVSVKLSNGNFLVIHYLNVKHYYLEITLNEPDSFQYTQNLADMNNGVEYLDDSYYRPIYARKHERGRIRYANSYSISQFDNFSELKMLNIHRLLSRFDKPIVKPGYLEDENKIHQDAIEDLKMRLFNDYFS